MVEENERKLNDIETSFGTDNAGFDGFKTWVNELLAKEPVPAWAKDLDSLHDVYKQYIYQKPQIPQVAKKISRSKVGGKVRPQIDTNGDFHDILRGAFS
jgi:hypothetical protein